MLSKLSERLEESLRDYLETNLTPSEMQGYNPNQSWSVDSPPDDALPIVTDWSDRGSTYPCIVVTEREGPSVPSSGTTNANGLQGDGSGVNQYSVHNITLSCQAIEGETYLNDTDPSALVQDLYSEVHATLQSAAPNVVSEAEWSGVPTPPTITTSQDEDDSGSTDTWWQCQGTVPVGVQYEP